MKEHFQNLVIQEGQEDKSNDMDKIFTGLKGFHHSKLSTFGRKYDFVI